MADVIDPSDDLYNWYMRVMMELDDSSPVLAAKFVPGLPCMCSSGAVCIEFREPGPSFWGAIEGIDVFRKAGSRVAGRWVEVLIATGNQTHESMNQAGHGGG